ncbi:MAG: hypothetical protein B7Z55_10600, partial [Planctomycetales bacterium 12-60-4]
MKFSDHLSVPAAEFLNNSTEIADLAWLKLPTSTRNDGAIEMARLARIVHRSRCRYPETGMTPRFDHMSTRRIEPWIPTEQEECWSRLLYVVEQRRFAMLTGPAEIGKSWMLDGIREHATRNCHFVQYVDASGLCHAEFAQQLAAFCGDLGSSWATIEDWLWGATAGAIPSLWIIDHADHALDELSPSVRRLVRLIEQTRAPASVIVAGRSRQELSSLGDLADLWCELPSWSLESTAEHIEHCWQSTESHPPFTTAAVQGIYDCTQGVAGRVR